MRPAGETLQTLIKETTAYKLFAAEARRGETAGTTLVIFPDADYLRLLLKTFAAVLYPDARTDALIARESFADCHIYPPVGQKYTVDIASAIVEESAMQPVEGGKVVFLLDAFHTAMPIVQNKLLKILEEPPAGVFFLIGAVSEHAVLPTVLSRAKKFFIEPFSEQQIEDALRRTHVRDERVKAAAAASGGIYSSAEKLLLGEGEDFAAAEAFFAGKDIETLCRGLKERKDKTSFFAALKLVARDLMLFSLGQGGDVKFNADPAQAALALYVRIQKEKNRWQMSLS